MRVPFLDLAAQLETTRPDVEHAVLDVIASGRYVGGPVLESFERAMAGYVGVDHAVGVSSGTDALVSLMALGVGPGDLVVTTPYSFFATAGSAARLGAAPVFIDIDPRTFNIDPARLADWFERETERRSRVKEIVPVHLFGQCADMAPILELAAAHRDPGRRGCGADAGGALSPPGWRPAGRYDGNARLLLLLSHQEPRRAMGDTGLVVTADPDLAARVRRLRNHGGHAAYRQPQVGGNFRLDTLQAAILAAELPHIDGWHAQRRERAAHYDRRHLGIPGLELQAASTR